MFWDGPVSWRRWKMALDCPRQLQFLTEKTRPSEPKYNYYTMRGKLIQLVFTLYFNKKLNSTSKGRKIEVLHRITDKVLDSPKLQGKVFAYPANTSMTTLRQTIHYYVENGFDIFENMKLLEKNLGCEVVARGKILNLPVMGILDFYNENPSSVDIYDGKANAKQDADPRQLWFYALILSSVGKKVRRVGFLYWRSAYKMVDIGPIQLNMFVDHIRTTAPLFHELRTTGITRDLEAKPGKQCFQCSWKRNCPSSEFYREDIATELSGEVSF